MPFEKYIEVVSYQQTEDELTNLINLVSILNNLPIEEVEKMTAKEFKKYAQPLAFLTKEPSLKGAKIKWKIKTLDKITMDEFIDFESMKNDTVNIATILSFMSEKTEEEILKMSTVEVLNGFFLLNLKLKKFIAFSLLSLGWKKMKEKVKKSVGWLK